MAVDIKTALEDKKKEKPNHLYSEFAGMFGLSEDIHKVESIQISKVVSYAGHPFKVIDDYRLRMLAADIKERGIVSPVIVRNIGFEEKYEILSGHRRTEASKIAGLNEIKAIIVKVTDEQAAQIVVMSNFLQRDTILPSERARSYMLRNEYLKKARKCSNNADSQTFSHGGKNDSDTYEVLSAEFGESKSNIFRYIRLNFLIEEFLDLVDKRKLKLIIAVDLSYLESDHQKLVYQYFFAESKYRLEQNMIKKITELASTKKLDEQALDQAVKLDALSKDRKGSLAIKPSVLKKYREHFRSDKELADAVIRFLDDYIKNK